MGAGADAPAKDEAAALRRSFARRKALLIFRRLFNTWCLDRPPSMLGPAWIHAFNDTVEKDLDGLVSELSAGTVVVDRKEMMTRQEATHLLQEVLSELPTAAPCS
jgi:hypothetical protein